MLQQIRREVGNATPLTLLLGAVIGAGLTRWLTQPLNLGTTFALETTILDSVQIFSPLVVNLVWIGSCVPARLVLDSDGRTGASHQRLGFAVATAMAGALLLLPYFILGLFLASSLASPRTDLEQQLPLFFGSLTPMLIGIAMLRTVVFAAASASITHLIGKRCRSHPERLPALISAAMINGSTTVVLLEVFWLAILPPAIMGPS